MTQVVYSLKCVRCQPSLLMSSRIYLCEYIRVRTPYSYVHVSGDMYASGTGYQVRYPKSFEYDLTIILEYSYDVLFLLRKVPRSSCFFVHEPFLYRAKNTIKFSMNTSRRYCTAVVGLASTVPGNLPCTESWIRRYLSGARGTRGAFGTRHERRIKIWRVGSAMYSSQVRNQYVFAEKKRE